MEELASEFGIRTQVGRRRITPVMRVCGPSGPSRAAPYLVRPDAGGRGAAFVHAQDAIKHLKNLDASGLITGVLDDRGKYICISPEELDQVAQFVARRGRVSRTYGLRAEEAQVAVAVGSDASPG